MDGLLFLSPRDVHAEELGHRVGLHGCSGAQFGDDPFSSNLARVPGHCLRRDGLGGLSPRAGRKSISRHRGSLPGVWEC